MIEKIFDWESTRARQREAPVFREREEYLAHLLQQGTSRLRVRTVASMLLNVIRLMELESMREVDIAEIVSAGHRWQADIKNHISRAPGPGSVETFKWVALKWFRFHNLVKTTTPSPEPTDVIVDQFVYYITVHKGMAPSTIRHCKSRVSHFLKWLFVRHEDLSSVTLHDVDDYLENQRNTGIRPRTIASICAALRLFFRYAQMFGWTDSKIARGIRSPRIPRYEVAPKGPKWTDVRRLLDATTGPKPSDLRASAILSLCSIYAIRASEIVSLMLNDFDWVNETFTVRRSKRGRIQQYPLQFEVGEAILKYLQHGRPQCTCRSLFVTIKPPFKPMHVRVTWTVVARRMKLLGIESEKFGAHALRHSCATELLRKGSSLRDIADFLGHRDLQSVSIYAKYDIKTLREIAAFSLGGVI